MRDRVAKRSTNQRNFNIFFSTRDKLNKIQKRKRAIKLSSLLSIDSVGPRAR